jgi:hypothetical protein
MAPTIDTLWAFTRREFGMNRNSEILDVTALKFNQLAIILLVLIGFITDEPYLAAFVAAVLLVGAFSPGLGLFRLTYLYVVKPLKLLKPEPVEDNPSPHRFAQLLGGILLGVGSVFLFAGFHVVGWTLAWIVVFLAAANVIFGFCAGCFVYYQLARLRVPGFRLRGTGGKAL